MQKKVKIISCLWVLFVAISVAGQDKYMPDLGPQLGKYAIEAREPGFDAFVVYNDGTDTIKGKKVKRHVGGSIFHLNRDWTMDGYRIPSKNIAVVQTKYAFLIKADHGFYARVYRGNINLYCWNQSYRTKVSLFYDSTRNQNIELRKSIPPKFLFFGNNSIMKIVSISALKKFLEHCPEAISSIDQEFSGTAWASDPDAPILNINESVVEKLIRVLATFNNCKL